MKNVIVITRSDKREYPVNHPFLEAEEILLSPGSLVQFVVEKIDLSLLVDGNFKEWFLDMARKPDDLVMPEPEFLEFRKNFEIDPLGVLSTYTAKIKWFLRNKTESFHQHVAGGYDQPWFRYKEMVLSDGTVIRVLPCYKEFLAGYQPLDKSDREDFLDAIANQFELSEKDENQVYCHDTEWGLTKRWDCVCEIDKRSLKNIFKEGVRIFIHSERSKYKSDILDKVNFQGRTIMDAVTQVLLRPCEAGSWTKLASHVEGRLSCDIASDLRSELAREERYAGLCELAGSSLLCERIIKDFFNKTV